MPRVPRPVTVVLAVLVALLLPLAMASAWVAAVVSDTDRFVSKVAPLAEDPEVQAALRSAVGRAAVSAVDVDARAAELDRLLAARGVPEALRRVAGTLGASLEQAVTDATDRVAGQVVTSPQFKATWSEASLRTHATLVGVLSGEDDRLVAEDGSLVLGLEDVLAPALDRLEVDGWAADAATSAAAAQPGIPLLAADQLATARTGYRVLDAVGTWLPGLTLVLLLVTVLTARDGRRTGLGLGLAAAAAAALLAVALVLLRGSLLASAPGPDAATILGAAWDALSRDLWVAVWVVLGLGALAAVACWAGGRSVPE
ncbi:MAG TPA: hypothetical protein VES95_08395 [Dermatophilaceae bacterium]|nr:hypothetical protein [Dermatophilaceae bacterium]